MCISSAFPPLRPLGAPSNPLTADEPEPTYSLPNRLRYVPPSPFPRLANIAWSFQVSSPGRDPAAVYGGYDHHSRLVFHPKSAARRQRHLPQPGGTTVNVTRTATRKTARAPILTMNGTSARSFATKTADACGPAKEFPESRLIVFHYLGSSLKFTFEGESSEPLNFRPLIGHLRHDLPASHLSQSGMAPRPRNARSDVRLVEEHADNVKFTRNGGRWWFIRRVARISRMCRS